MSSEHALLLSRVPFFAGVERADLARFAERATVRHIGGGEPLIEQGSAADALYVVIRGRFEVSWRGPAGATPQADDEAALNVCGPGDVLGEMSLLEQAPRSARVRALDDGGDVLCLSNDDFREILRSCETALAAILGTIARRLRNNEVTLQRGFRLASLGRLAAGLAHELNNPSSAVRRSAELLGQRLSAWEKLAEDAWLPPLPAPAPAALGLATLERAEREERLEGVLAARGIGDAWELAPPLVAAGYDGAQLKEAPIEAVRWLAIRSTARELVSEIRDAADRIAAIVQSVKTYAYLGRAPVSEVDIHAGLESTLTMLGHAMKGIRVTRDFTPGLPRIEATGSELNQVWTNLIDNALAAMGGSGELVVRTFAPDPLRVAVEIIDSGPGIADDVRGHLFEPFFTTKPLGSGSGLGLYISHNIVVVHHGGSIQVVESRPGRTIFRVTLPVKRG